MINRTLWLALFGRGGSSPVARYFRRNEGTTDYGLVPVVTLAGDFVIGLLISKSGVDDGNLLTGAVEAPAFRLAVFNNTVRVDVDGAEKASFDIAGIDLSLLRALVLTRVGGIFSCSLSGVTLTPIVTTGSNLPIHIRYIYNKFTGSGIPNWEGILADLKIEDNGTLIRDYPLDEPKGTSVIYDNAGGNNGAIINGNDEDKGLFTEQANGDWLGQVDVWTKGAYISTGSEGTFQFVQTQTPSGIIVGSSYRAALSTLNMSSGEFSARIGELVDTLIANSNGSITTDVTATTSNLRTLVRSQQTNAGAEMLLSVKEVLKSA